MLLEDNNHTIKGKRFASNNWIKIQQQTYDKHVSSCVSLKRSLTFLRQATLMKYFL